MTVLIEEPTSRRKIATDLYLDGWTMAKIAKFLGISKARVWQYLREREDFKELKRLSKLARQKLKNS